MTEETSEEKIARYEFVLDAYVRELTKLREENARLRSAAGAHDVLKAIYQDPDAPQGNRIKAAQAALNVEKPRLEPVPPPMDLVAEEYEPLAVLVERQRKRCDQMLADDPQFRAVRSHQAIELKPNGNGSDDDTRG
jgi:hypothetical protein